MHGTAYYQTKPFEYLLLSSIHTIQKYILIKPNNTKIQTHNYIQYSKFKPQTETYFFQDTMITSGTLSESSLEALGGNSKLTFILLVFAELRVQNSNALRSSNTTPSLT